MLKLVPCYLDIKSTPLHDATIITYVIYLPPSENEISFNLLYDGDFTILYIIDKIPNSPAGHQFPIQAKIIVWTISIHGEESITKKGELGELKNYHNQREESKVDTGLFQSKIHQFTDIEELWSRFDQIRPLVYHL